jgi:glycosyltransferase involved in cell wall biosynthesis
MIGKDQPKVSVIIATFNVETSLNKTIDSVLSQSYPNIEIIVIDGGSSDGTVPIVQDYGNSIKYFISEPDKGIADAYNKGILASSGKWLYFLNSDDVFVNSNTVYSINLLGKDDLVLVGRVVSDTERVFKGRFNWILLVKNTVHHQAIFYRSDFLKLFPYNSEYVRYGHDHEHNLMIWKMGIKTRYIKQDVAIWASGGISDNANWNDYKEEFRVRRNVFGRISFLFNMFTILRFVIKKIKKGAKYEVK